MIYPKPYSIYLRGTIFIWWALPCFGMAAFILQSHGQCPYDGYSLSCLKGGGYTGVSLGLLGLILPVWTIAHIAMIYIYIHI